MKNFYNKSQDVGITQFDQQVIKSDGRCSYGRNIKKMAIILYLEGNGLRKIARLLSKIFNINVSFQIVSHWISSAGKFVNEEIALIKKQPANNLREIEFIETDFVYTYIKKVTSKPLKSKPKIDFTENLEVTISNKTDTTIEYGWLFARGKLVCINLN